MASLALNGTLAVIKLLAGVAGHSTALVADAVESLGDIFGSAIVWGGLVIAARPADENHPYGHGKAEPLAALAVAALLIVAAAGIVVQCVAGIQSPQRTPAAYTLAVLLGVVVIKEAMYRYLSRTAQRIGSSAIVADAWHHRSDAITSMAAAIGISIALVGGEGYESADQWAALLACVVIVLNALRLVRQAINELMDATPDTLMHEGIEAAALEVSGARAIETVLVRKMGPQLYVDLHLEVDPDLAVLKAHAIGHDVKDAIMAKYSRVADVLVHVEPFGGCEREH